MSPMQFFILVDRSFKTKTVIHVQLKMYRPGQIFVCHRKSSHSKTVFRLMIYFTDSWQWCRLTVCTIKTLYCWLHWSLKKKKEEEANLTLFTVSKKQTNTQFSFLLYCWTFHMIGWVLKTRLTESLAPVTSQRDNFQNGVTSRADLRHTLQHNMLTWEGEVCIARARGAACSPNCCVLVDPRHVLFSTSSHSFWRRLAVLLVTHPALPRHRCLPCSPSCAAPCDHSAPPCCGPWSRMNPTHTPPRNCLVFWLSSWWRRVCLCSSAAAARTDSLHTERGKTRLSSSWGVYVTVAHSYRDEWESDKSILTPRKRLSRSLATVSKLSKLKIYD